MVRKKARRPIKKGKKLGGTKLGRLAPTRLARASVQREAVELARAADVGKG